MTVVVVSIGVATNGSSTGVDAVSAGVETIGTSTGVEVPARKR